MNIKPIILNFNSFKNFNPKSENKSVSENKNNFMVHDNALSAFNKANILFCSREIPESKKDLIIKLACEGKKMPEIAKEVGCSQSTVYNTIRKGHLERKEYNLDRNIDRIIEMYNQGMSQKEIGHEMNCTESAISFALKRHGIKYKRILARSREKIFELYNQGYSEAEIANMLGSSKPSIKRILKSGAENEN